MENDDGYDNNALCLHPSLFRDVIPQRTNNSLYTSDLVVGVVLGGFPSISFIPTAISAIATIVYYCAVGCMTVSNLEMASYSFLSYLAFVTLLSIEEECCRIRTR